MRKRKLIVGCSILCCNVFMVQAQNKSTEHGRQLWFGYFNQTRLSRKWGLWADVHLRTKENFVNNFSQSIARFGVSYYFNDATMLTAGYAYTNNYPAGSHSKVTLPEHNPWLQLQLRTAYGKKNTLQRLRLEEHYVRKLLNDSTLGTGYNFNYRLGYYFSFNAPFSKKGIVAHTLSLSVNNEVFINFGRQVVNNYFDQNRFFAGVRYQLSHNSGINLGYMNLFQELPGGNKYRDLHAIRLYFIQNFDLRSKAPAKEVFKHSE